MDNVVETSGLTKTYGGQVVVDAVDLAVPKASVYGFLGPNGSGKTTTMKMLLSLVQPTSGEVTVFGQRMERSSRRSLLAGIGALIESPPGYAHLSGAENMAIVAHLLGLRPAQVDRAVRAVRMEGQMAKKVANYSLGMKQRLGIAMALARDPRLLVLDEPTNGLDPAGIEEIRDLLTSLAREEGITVMISSHLLAEVQRTATVFGILNRGRLVFQGTRAQLLERSRPDLVIETADTGLVMAGAYRPEMTAGDRQVRIAGVGLEQTPDLVRDLVGADVRIDGVRREEQSLEDVFITLTGRDGLL